MLRRRGPRATRADEEIEWWEAAGGVDHALGSRSVVVAVAEFAPHATVDLLPDPSWPAWNQIPDDARDAREALVGLASPANRRDPHFRWEVDLTDPTVRHQVATWAPHSINVDLYRTPARLEPAVLNLSDEGYAVDLRVTGDEALTVGAILAELGYRTRPSQELPERDDPDARWVRLEVVRPQ